MRQNDAANCPLSVQIHAARVEICGPPASDSIPPIPAIPLPQADGRSSALKKGGGVFPPRRLISSRLESATDPYFFRLQQPPTEQLAGAADLLTEQQPFSAQHPSTQQAGQAQFAPQHEAQSAQQQPAAFVLALALSDRPPRPRTVATAANDRIRDMESLRTFGCSWRRITVVAMTSGSSPFENRRSTLWVDQATFGGGVGGTSRRLERTKDGCRHSCTSTGDDHSNGPAGTIPNSIVGQHEQPHPPIPPQHDFTGSLARSER